MMSSSSITWTNNGAWCPLSWPLYIVFLYSKMSESVSSFCAKNWMQVRSTVPVNHNPGPGAFNPCPREPRTWTWRTWSWTRRTWSWTSLVFKLSFGWAICYCLFCELGLFVLCISFSYITWVVMTRSSTLWDSSPLESSRLRALVASVFTLSRSSRARLTFPLLKHYQIKPCYF